ncbi:MAG: hypothetical protein HY929_08835 [Euryarchaeota archaeon]|nr:hypothetical protein [Euryarchaeota archaeon]
MSMLTTIYGIVILAINAGFLIALLFLLFSSYRKMRSTFTLAMILFALVLLMKAIAKEGLYIAVFLGKSDIGLFYDYNVVTETTEFVALAILLYLMTR